MIDKEKVNIELIEFTGNEKSLLQLKNNIIYSDKGKNKLSYKIIELFIPEKRDEAIFNELKCNQFGLSYTNYLFKNNKSLKVQQINERINDYLQKYGFLGLRDNFINNNLSIWQWNINKEKLVIRLLNTNPFPIDFFKFVANKFKVNFFSIEKQNPQFLLTHYDYKTQNSKNTKLTLDNFVNNKDIQTRFLNLKIYNHSDLAFSYFLKNDSISFSTLIQQKQITWEKLLISIDEDFSKYNDSYFHSLSFLRQRYKNSFLNIHQIKNDIKELHNTVLLYEQLENNITSKNNSNNNKIHKI
jgi:hypothetical protein